MCTTLTDAYTYRLTMSLAPSGRYGYAGPSSPKVYRETALLALDGSLTPRGTIWHHAVLSLEIVGDEATEDADGCWSRLLVLVADRDMTETLTAWAEDDEDGDESSLVHWSEVR